MRDENIYVTKSFLPPMEEYQHYLDQIWSSGQLTNRGPLLRTFEDKVKDLLQVDHFQFVTNGTLALQLALRAVGATEGEVITTPFSYVATTSAILWEGSVPVFVDIDPETLCIDPEKIEAAITPQTKAILAVHVFGNACDVERIQEIADKHNLKVIYDGAHAFKAGYKGKSLLSYGDISITSFHATKLFHTIEGGGIFINNQELNDKVDLMKRFGHNNDTHISLGINAKANEFQAAMGLSNLKYIDDIIERRKQISERYDHRLLSKFKRPTLASEVDYNYAYYPVIFDTEAKTLELIERLNKANIFPRRYFYPSLNELPYLATNTKCAISEDISRRIVCLPLYYDLEDAQVDMICDLLLS